MLADWLSDLTSTAALMNLRASLLSGTRSRSTCPCKRAMLSWEVFRSSRYCPRYVLRNQVAKPSNMLD